MATKTATVKVVLLDKLTDHIRNDRADERGGQLAIDLAWCMECGVERGQPCVTTTHSTPAKRVHAARRTAACARLWMTATA